MNQIGLTGLCKIEFPGSTVRLCDGGFVDWGAERFQSKHETFGTIATVAPLAEGMGDEVPALELSFNPSGSATPGQLSQPGYQKSRVRFWIAEYDLTTGALVGEPDMMFDGQVDQTTLKKGATYELATSVVSTAERLFQRNAGNSLSDAWHTSIWPGEKGHANATNLSVPVAWGTESPQRNGNPGWNTGAPVWRA